MTLSDRTATHMVSISMAALLKSSLVQLSNNACCGHIANLCYWPLNNVLDSRSVITVHAVEAERWIYMLLEEWIPRNPFLLWSMYVHILHSKKVYFTVCCQPIASKQNMKTFCLKLFSFITGVVDTGDYLYIKMYSRIFVKTRNGSCRIFRAMEENDLWKKTEAENPVSDFL
jgi:hypothetical protein